MIAFIGYVVLVIVITMMMSLAMILFHEIITESKESPFIILMFKIQRVILVICFVIFLFYPLYVPNLEVLLQ